MHKLKHSFLMRLFAVKLSRAELNMVLYLCMHQDQQGNVTGVHYQDVTKYVDMCNQSFYNSLKSLCDKGIISCVHNAESGDYDVMIIGNDFADGNFECGYLSLRRKFLCSRIFMKLKSNEMLLILELLYRCGCNGGIFKIGRNTFISNFMEQLSVKERAIERYLHMLRHYFRITLKGKNYIFQAKGYTKININKRDEDFYNEYLVQTMARRKKIRKVSEQEISETAQLIKQYNGMAHERGKDIWQLLRESIDNSLKCLNRHKGKRDRKKYSLEFKLIHTILRESLQMA